MNILYIYLAGLFITLVVVIWKAENFVGGDAKEDVASLVKFLFLWPLTWTLAIATAFSMVVYALLQMIVIKKTTDNVEGMVYETLKEKMDSLEGEDLEEFKKQNRGFYDGFSFDNPEAHERAKDMLTKLGILEEDG